MSLRRSSGDVRNQPITADILPTQTTSSVRWVVENTAETETETAAGTLGDLYDGRSSNHRARSLPNLADEKLLPSDEREYDEQTKGTAAETAAAKPVVMVTDVNMVTSLVTSSQTSSSLLLKPNSSSSTSRMKRATSFAENPVITAVSSF